jgi:hypothetical protein
VAAREADRVRVLELKNQVAAMRWDNIQEANQRQEAEDQMKVGFESLSAVTACPTSS